MDESDIYYIDTRNADGRDHRTGQSSSSGHVPSGYPQRVRTVYAHPMPPSRVYAVPNQYPQYPQYAQPYPMAQSNLASNLLGRVSTGQIIDLVAQIFAALMPLPSAPVATLEANTDVGNLILYQGALAQYAKRDEQVRTLGNLVTKLVG